jgi:hypothetical protein
MLSYQDYQYICSLKRRAEGHLSQMRAIQATAQGDPQSLRDPDTLLDLMSAHKNHKTHYLDLSHRFKQLSHAAVVSAQQEMGDVEQIFQPGDPSIVFRPSTGGMYGEQSNNRVKCGA